MLKKIRRSLILTALLSFTLSLPACSQELKGIEHFPQDPLLYIKGKPDLNLIGEKRQDALYEKLRERFFSPWSQTESRDSSEVIKWVFKHYGNKAGFGENKRARSEKWIEKQFKRSNISQVDSLNRRAITLRSTALRLMPTERPFFLSFDLAGEGYPFDYLQNSLAHGGEPLFVSHLSTDGLWAWCDASYASGWVSMEDIAWVSDEQATEWASLPLDCVIIEGTTIRDKHGRGMFSAKVGAILPVVQSGITGDIVLSPSCDSERKLVPERASISRKDGVRMPLRASQWNLARVADQMTGEPYGWGGFLKDRDCSATTRDIMLPFGIWLPRNSRAQASSGENIPLDKLSRTQKKELIVQEGIPFISLLGQPGHIMLYLGTRRGEPMILHNMWGIKTEKEGREGRFVVGRCIISTLNVGEDLPDHSPDRLIIDRINRLTFPSKPE